MTPREKQKVVIIVHFNKAHQRFTYLVLIILANVTGFIALASAFQTPGMEVVRWSLLISAFTGAGAGLVNWMLHR